MPITVGLVGDRWVLNGRESSIQWVLTAQKTPRCIIEFLGERSGMHNNFGYQNLLKTIRKMPQEEENMRKHAVINFV